jgi:hypothetical protein
LQNTDSSGKIGKAREAMRGRENFMHRYFRVALKAATAVALVWGATMFTTNEASAQFGFEGMIRGAMGGGCCGGGFSRHHRGRVHETKHHRGSKDEDADDDDSKGKDKDTKSADNKSDMKPAAAVKVDSAPKQDQPQTAASNPPASTAKVNADIPAFTPSR